MLLRLFPLILARTSLSAVAQLALKAGTRAAAGRAQGVGGEISGLIQSPWVLVGQGLYGVCALLWPRAYGSVGIDRLAKYPG